MNILFLRKNINSLGFLKNNFLKSFNPVSKYFSNTINTDSMNNLNSTPSNESNTSTDSPKKKIEVELDKKKIFNKKTHYRNYFIDKKLDPPKSFEEQDTRELSDWHRKKFFDRRYVRIMDDWQVNLVEKKRKKAITKMNAENHVKPENELEKFVVHNPDKSISIPAPDDKIFAVIVFKGLQHKITKDDTIMMERVDDLNVGDTFTFDKVLLVGTDEYTSIGRPYVDSAKVLATVEEKSLTAKVIVFKKKRRKGYQRNQGHRQAVLLVRILKIIHNPPQETVDDYHSLIKI